MPCTGGGGVPGRLTRAGWSSRKSCGACSRRPGGRRRVTTSSRDALYDLGGAVAHLTLEATALSLHLHQMAGFYPDKAREAFAIPDTAEAVVAIAMGYLGDPDSLPDDLRQRELTPTTRKPMTEFVFAGRWGRAWTG